jgi:hypothetical protein
VVQQHEKTWQDEALETLQACLALAKNWVMICMSWAWASIICCICSSGADGEASVGFEKKVRLDLEIV